MKTTLLLIFCLFSVSCFCQNFDVKVSRFTNGCTGKNGQDMGEPQMRWSLSSQKADFYVVSNYDKSSRESWGTYNVKSFKTNNDPVNGKAYIYEVSSYKTGDGILIYVPTEKFIKLTWGNSDCSTVFYLY